MSETRRKLRLLPEVLPDPMLNRERSNGPRERTLTHLQRLFATAAAATAAASAADCGDKTDAVKPEPSATSTAASTSSPSALTQSDPVPPHTATAEASASAQGGVPQVIPDAGDDAGVARKKTPTVPTAQVMTHYTVVDPMPQPFIQPPTPTAPLPPTPPKNNGSQNP